MAPNVIHEFCIILSQDCDLLRDYELRKNGAMPALNGVLIYEAASLDQFRDKINNSGIWKNIRINTHERYHLLEGVPAEHDVARRGLPSLGIDFRRFFTMPAEEIERQCARPDGAKRRCRIEAPYREHLQARAASYLQRVMLPLRQSVVTGCVAFWSHLRPNTGSAAEISCSTTPISLPRAPVIPH